MSRPRRPRLSWLQLVTHIGAWIPLVVLVYDFLNNQLTINPIQAAEQRTGSIAIILLILSLTCTPLNTLFRFSEALKVRRPLGLYGYMYAAIHLLIFTGVDYGFDLGLLMGELTQKRYIIVGAAAFLLLSLVALTSFRWWMVRLGKNWKRLHRLVYLINLLVVIHFAWSVKGDIFRLQGDVFRPLLAGIVVVLLLVFRLPAVRRRLSGIFRFHPVPRGRPELIKHQSSGD